MHINQLLAFQHIILLQGPVGPFFSNLAHYLRRQNPTIKITKINFCFGDQLFFSPPPNTSVIPFTQKIESFPSTLTNLLLLPENRNLSTAIALFGDCRPYHLMAFDTIKNLPPTSTTPQLVTFEEGYIRPQYFTMEFGRVNGFSEPISPAHPPQNTTPPNPPPLPLQKAKKYMILHGVRFAIANALLNPLKYPSYKSWRDMPLAHTTLKAITFLFKYHLLQKNTATNRRVFSWSQKNPKKYFILALQLAHDSQIKHHSDSSQEAFLSHSLRSFASFAHPNHHLIIKAHPLDIDPDYWHSQIIEQVYDLNLQHRVHFITDSPNTLSLLSNASGLLCINSTLAISALELNIPSFPYGRAIYKLPQLTPSPSLHAFFQHPQPPNPLFFSSWKQALIHRNQIPGNVYLPAHTLHSLYNPTA